MDKTADTFDEGDVYAKRLLDRSHYSDCHSQSLRRRLSVMEALSKSSLDPRSNRHYEGNPFEKEFSEANRATDADQPEMTYVSTWPEDNAELSSRTYDVEPRDSLFCAKSHGAAKAATNQRATEYRSSEQFRRDIVDTDAESIGDSTKPRLPLSREPTLFIGERFGPLTPNELTMQSKLNLKFEREFEQYTAQMELQGPDEFFGARVVEICEPTIIKFHRKSCDSEVAETQTRKAELTYTKEDTVKYSVETDLEVPHFTPPSIPDDGATQTHPSELTYIKEEKVQVWKKAGSNARTSSSLGSEDLRDLDREIDQLFDNDDDASEKTAPPQREISATFEIVGSKISKDTVDGKDGSRQRDYVMLPGQPANRSSMENFDGDRKPSSPKNATFSMSPSLENSTRHQPNVSKTTSFIKRHTSFLFKNLRTPKLVRRKSSAESTRKTPSKVTGSPWPQPSTSALTRSNTMGSSDNDKPTTMFQQQVKQVQADLPPDMDDTMASEMESFLKLALGSGEYNSTMAQANFDSKDQTYSVLSNNATLSESKNDRTMRDSKNRSLKHSGTLNRTMSIYKTLTQKIRDKFRKYDHSDTNPDAISNLDQQNIMLENLKPEIRAVVKELQDKVNIQSTLIYQTSKALQLCDSMPEFTASPERVEYERILLLAILTKNVVLREIDRLIGQKAQNSKNEDYAYTERGEVTLKDIRMQLREDVLRRERQNGDVVEWFVMVVIQGATVWATPAVPCPMSSPVMYFPGVHVISGLTPDFRLSIKVYSLKLQQLRLFNHDDKYHISRSCTFGAANKIKTPKMLRRKSVSPKQYRVKFTGIKETSFAYCGGVQLMLFDLKLPSPWPLYSMSPNSVLHGTVDLNFSCRLELSMFHAGFLTHCEETGDLAWNRRWCLLEGHKLLFWNYPREQEYNPPIYVIDLVNCVSASVDLVDRRKCPRPRTLLLKTKEKTNEKNRIVVESRIDGSMTRHLLSYDNNNELAEWHSKLNHVVSALSAWNIINAPRVS